MDYSKGGGIIEVTASSSDREEHSSQHRRQCEQE